MHTKKKTIKIPQTQLNISNIYHQTGFKSEITNRPGFF